jgi:serine/threonine-protein kinase
MTHPIDSHTGGDTLSKNGADMPSPEIQAAARFAPGTILANRYRVVALIKRGGMGEVYRAEDTKLGQEVALKFVRGILSRETLGRLYDEVKIGRQVSHPSVCRLHDIAEHAGHTFLAMEYVDGEDLASLLERIGRLSPERALDITRDLLSGLAAVHEKGIVHRDLKPANVMIDGHGRAHITDFGLAVSLGEARGSSAGTPPYMAPEQFEGRATARSDLYALGLVVFEMLTGQRFFEARTLEGLRMEHREAKAPRLSKFAPVYDLGLGGLILESLEEDPEARPPAARSVLARLPFADPLEAAVAAGETPRARRGRGNGRKPSPCSGLAALSPGPRRRVAERLSLRQDRALPQGAASEVPRYPRRACKRDPGSARADGAGRLRQFLSLEPGVHRLSDHPRSLSLPF